MSNCLNGMLCENLLVDNFHLQEDELLYYSSYTVANQILDDLVSFGALSKDGSFFIADNVKYYLLKQDNSSSGCPDFYDIATAPASNYYSVSSSLKDGIYYHSVSASLFGISTSFKFSHVDYSCDQFRALPIGILLFRRLYALLHEQGVEDCCLLTC